MNLNKLTGQFNSTDQKMAFYWMGNDTHKVPMKMHRDNRNKLCGRMLKALPNINGAVAIFQGGKSACRNATDHEELFRQESFFQYLFGVKEPDFYGAIDLSSKKSILFIPRLPAEYAYWMGKIQPPAYFRDMYEVDEVHFVDEIVRTLHELKAQTIHFIQGTDTDSGEMHAKPHFEGIENFAQDGEKLFNEIVECRVIKSNDELDLLRYVNKISSDAHNEVMLRVKVNSMEYQSEATFLFECYSKGGCRNVSYTCICGTGDNSAILHYGHAAAPNSKQLKNGDMALFDMGAEYHCYNSDITCSFPVNGKFTEDQKAIYETVLAAQQAVLNEMKPGVSWFKMHRLSNRIICERLKSHNLLIGDVDEMMSNHIGALFMPHGLGHLMGLDTHDCGGYPNGLKRIQEPGIKSLRCGRDLEEGMVITVEPGVYFIESLLLPAFEDPQKSKFLNIPKLNQFLHFGGIRLEDDVIVTKDGIENMTKVPRTVKEIEEHMARAVHN